MIQEFPVFLLTPRHGLLHHAPVQSGSLAPSWAVWLQSYFGDMPHAPAFRWLRSYRAKCNAEIQINFKKIQRRYSSSCSTSHCSHSESRGQHSRHCSNCPAQATEETARLALQVRYLFIRGKPLCQAVACHSPLVPFGETPETRYQSAVDQPPYAVRSQRPAATPPSKQPSASHSLCPDVPASVYSPSANPVVEPPPTFVGIMIPRFGSVVSSVIYFQDAAVYATCAIAFL